jgi:hypothetical protein
MQSDIRRIVAAEAHRRRSGSCPRRIYSLGTGEAFDIAPEEHGFKDLATGTGVATQDGTIRFPDGRAPIELRLVGDVAFDGFDHAAHEAFSGRAGGGSSVTIFVGAEYFQYAVFADDC